MVKIHGVIAGEKFSNLTVIEDTGKMSKYHKRIVLCKCECGVYKELVYNNVKSGKVRSCGCLKRTHSSSKTKLYRKWADMLQRCSNDNSTNYKYYGAKGISVCDEWKTFINFKTWSENNGYEESLTIDRIDPLGNYEPSNCKWSTRKEQDRNKRDTRYAVIKGERLSLMDISEKYNISYGCLAYRYNQGYEGDNLIKPSQRGVKL